MSLFRRSALAATLLAASLVVSIGCANMSRTQKGAVIGAGMGGAAGAIIGKQVGSTTKGAIIGAAVGGVAGAIIGRQMDKQAEELIRDIPGATVQRVGEGIVVTFDSGLMFDFDSDAIKGETRANLNRLANSLQQYGNTDVQIVGHTDAQGTDSYNQDLSERRAASAKRYLVSQGVSSPRVITMGRGESEPIASNANDAGRQENRRVEIAIFASDELQSQARREASGG
jgi:outer membrane protein OmpA-like peptidoglycan-associated protein